MVNAAKSAGGALVGRLASRLRFPQLFVLVLVLFLVDLLVPDLIPFVDEVLLGLATLLLGSWKQRKQRPKATKPPMKDVTPPPGRVEAGEGGSRPAG